MGLTPLRVSFKHSASYRLCEQSLANFFHTGKSVMSYQDRTLSCVECAQSFTFSADDQSYHAEKGYTNEPKRCESCRQARRANQSTGGGFGSDRGPREMHSVVCAECGNQATVPFLPRGDRPVYCSDCFSRQGGGGGGGGRY